MKKIYLLFSIFVLAVGTSFSQLTIDTIAFQDFETVPASPTWSYTGTLADLQSGNAGATTSIPSSPLGIGSTQAWHVASVSGGNEIIFDNTSIPAGYDSVRVNFNLSAMNLTGSTGGPDDLDYVLVEYSLDNGATWVGRLRIRGFGTSGAFWPYSASGVAKEYYLPATESTYQPTSTGFQDAEGYSFCEISFPGSISQLALRVKPRSSSGSDSWLIDNLVLTGETACTNTTSSFAVTACDDYTAPSGSVYTSSGLITDIIPNMAGCDSIMSIDVTINTVDATASQLDVLTIQSNTASATSYQWLDCDNSYTVISGANSQSFTASTNGNYAVEVTNNGCVDTSSCFIVNSVGYEELKTTQIEIYPNPVQSIIWINGLQNSTDFVRLELATVTGQVIRTFYTKMNQIDLLDLPHGIYFINLIEENTSISKRFIKL